MKRMERFIISLFVAFRKSMQPLAIIVALGGVLMLAPGAAADEIANDFEIPVPADRAEPVPPPEPVVTPEPMATPEPVVTPAPVAKAPAPTRMNPYQQECCAADEYDDSQSHPLRVAAYLLHPVGYGLEWLIFRPIHWVVSKPSLLRVFGHDCHEGDDGCRY